MSNKKNKIWINKAWALFYAFIIQCSNLEVLLQQPPDIFSQRDNNNRDNNMYKIIVHLLKNYSLRTIKTRDKSVTRKFWWDE